MKLAIFRRCAFGRHFKTKFQRTGFNARKGTDLQPEIGDFVDIVLFALLLNNFNDVLTQREFVHDT